MSFSLLFFVLALFSVNAETLTLAQIRALDDLMETTMQHTLKRALMGAQTDGSDLVTGLDALFVQAKTSSNYVSVSPVDANHTIASTYGGLYSQSFWNSFDIAGFAFILNQYGVNYATATPNAYGGRSVPGYGTLYPVAFGYENTTRFILNSDNRKIGKENTWIALKFGLLAIMSTNGTWPGGVNGGKPFNANDVIGYTLNIYLDLDRDNKWSTKDERWRIEVNVQSNEPTSQVTNMYGLTDTYGKEAWTWIRDNGDILTGCAKGSTTQTRNPDNTITYTSVTTALMPCMVTY